MLPCHIELVFTRFFKIVSGHVNEVLFIEGNIRSVRYKLYDF